MELTNQSLLENDLIHSLSRKRINEVSKKATAFNKKESPIALESQEMFSSISDTIKTLEDEQKDLFPDKETELEEIKTSEENNDKVAEKKETTSALSKNNQALYYVGAVVVVLGVIYVYQKTNGFKNFKIK